MTREPISTGEAPAAIGPYSQAIRAGGLLFVSGQIPLDPATGTLVQGTMADQTRRVFANVRAVLEAGGSSLAQVVKTTIFLIDMDDFAAMNEAYASVFPVSPPARATVEVSRLPKDARIEVDVIALAG
jgi:2-iminobutanoate/2-iminopropanoate deaminase